MLYGCVFNTVGEELISIKDTVAELDNNLADCAVIKRMVRFQMRFRRVIKGTRIYRILVTNKAS